MRPLLTAWRKKELTDVFLNGYKACFPLFRSFIWFLSVFHPFPSLVFFRRSPFLSLFHLQPKNNGMKKLHPRFIQLVQHSTNLLLIFLFFLFFLLFGLFRLFFFFYRLGEMSVHIQSLAHFLPVRIVSKMETDTC